MRSAVAVVVVFGCPSLSMSFLSLPRRASPRRICDLVFDESVIFSSLPTIFRCRCIFATTNCIVLIESASTSYVHEEISVGFSSSDAMERASEREEEKQTWKDSSDRTSRITLRFAFSSRPLLTTNSCTREKISWRINCLINSTLSKS